jgi:hypothetical protein
VLGCPWQRCTVHFLREALGHARREQQPMLAALLRPIFSADSGEQARQLVGAGLEGSASRCRRWRRCSRRPRRTCSPSPASHPTTGRSCARRNVIHGGTGPCQAQGLRMVGGLAGDSGVGCRRCEAMAFTELAQVGWRGSSPSCCWSAAAPLRPGRGGQAADLAVAQSVEAKGEDAAGDGYLLRSFCPVVSRFARSWYGEGRRSGRRSGPIR